MPASRLHHVCLAALSMVLLASAMPAHSQVSLLPPDVQRVLADVGPQWGKALAKNIETTIATFQPILKAAPKDGVVVSKNLAYGEDPKQILDVYQPQGVREAPVVIFIHGGAYVRGDKDLYGEMYGNISTWFARQGALGINATYRLAPGAKWPSAADDVRAMVKWAKENAGKFGGDPNRVYLVGHSAGATRRLLHFRPRPAARHRARRKRRGPDQRPLSPRIRPGRSERQEHAGLFRRGQQRLSGAIADHAYP
jgi:acetyl esterase/lipase